MLKRLKIHTPMTSGSMVKNDATQIKMHIKETFLPPNILSCLSWDSDAPPHVLHRLCLATQQAIIAMVLKSTKATQEKNNIITNHNCILSLPRFLKRPTQQHELSSLNPSSFKYTCIIIVCFLFLILYASKYHQEVRKA